MGAKVRKFGQTAKFFCGNVLSKREKVRKDRAQECLTGGVPVAACAHRCRRRFAPAAQRPGADVGQLAQTAAYERRPFSLQLTAYCSLIHGLLQHGLPPFGDRGANGLQPDGYANAACLRHGVPAHRANRRCDDGRECPIRHFPANRVIPKSVQGQTVQETARQPANTSCACEAPCTCGRQSAGSSCQPMQGNTQSRPSPSGV